MSRPWMPLYIADYRADTAHLSGAQHGAYLLLIMHYWQTGSLPADDTPLARIACMTPTEWRKIRPVVAAFFTADWKHKRIDAELARASEISSKRRASAQQKHSKSSASAEQLDTHARASSPSLSPSKDSDVRTSAAVAAPVYTDSKHELWGEGVAILAQLGVSERNARSNIGRWLKSNGDDCPALLAAIQRAREHKIIDPIPWITRALETTGPPERRGKKGFLDLALELDRKDDDDGAGKYHPPKLAISSPYG